MTATTPMLPDPRTPPPGRTDGYHPAGRHIAALVIGCLLLLPGLGLLLGGAGLGITYAVGRDDAGYLSLTLPALSSPTPAITAEDVVVETGPDVPSWVLDRLDLDLRLTARPLASGPDVFLGVAPASSLTAYLEGVSHDQVVGITSARDGTLRAAVLRSTPGAATVAAPTAQTFWTTSATGAGQQEPGLARDRRAVGRRHHERRRQRRRRREPRRSASGRASSCPSPSSCSASVSS